MNKIHTILKRYKNSFLYYIVLKDLRTWELHFETAKRRHLARMLNNKFYAKLNLTRAH